MKSCKGIVLLDLDNAQSAGRFVRGCKNNGYVVFEYGWVLVLLVAVSVSHLHSKKGLMIYTNPSHLSIGDSHSSTIQALILAHGQKALKKNWCA